MSTFLNKYDTIENLILNEGLRIKSVEFDLNHKRMFVFLTNNASFVIPTKIYKNLSTAPAVSLDNFRLVANGTGIHWPDLDEDLSLKGFFREYLKQLINKEKQLEIS